MRQKSGPAKAPAEAVLKDIRRATRRHFSAEDKIRIALEGLRGEEGNVSFGGHDTQHIQPLISPWTDWTSRARRACMEVRKRGKTDAKK